MEDLFGVQAKHIDTVFKATGEIQAEDLISQAVYEVSSLAYQIISAFRANRFSAVSINATQLTPHLLVCVEWITAIFYVLNIDPPDLEDVSDFADGFDPEIVADAVLACLHVQKSVADFALTYFCEGAEAASEEELDQSLNEALACLELLARRLGSTLPKLITNV